jgi:hypothetical protein
LSIIAYFLGFKILKSVRIHPSDTQEHPSMYLQEVTQQDQILEIFKLILPFITLVLGFVLGVWNELRKEIKNIDNMKTIIFWELFLADHFVYKLFSKKEEGILEDVKRCAIANEINVQIFDRYLDKVYVLKKDELSKLLFAYQSLKSLKSVAANHMKLIEEEINSKGEIDENHLDERFLKSLTISRKNLNGEIIRAKETTTSALNRLVKGRKDLEKILTNFYSSKNTSSTPDA